MVNNQDLFTVTFNLSQLIKNKEESQLVTLLDESKMTFVYEVVEWIRWIFSLDNCFHLTHNNSIIHATEKIRILALLKTIDVKPCTVENGYCYFSKLDNLIFNKLNFFQKWMNMKVPRFFVENLSTINLKLNLANERDENEHINELDSRCNVDMENKTLDNFNKNQNKCVKQIMHKKKISTETISSLTINPHQQINDIKVSSSNNKINSQMFEEELAEMRVEKINNIKSSVALEKQSQENDKDCSNANNFQKYKEVHLKSNNVEEMTNDTKEDITKKKKFRNVYCGKPFSIGETLNNLRNSLEYTSDFFCNKSSLENGSFSDLPVSDCNKNVSNLTSSLYNMVNMKKRKRIRRSRSRKKKNYEELNKFVVPSEKRMWNNDNEITSVKENKSKHIRFNSSNDNSDSDSSESKIKLCKVFSEDKRNSDETSQAIETLQNKNFDEANSCNITYDKTQDSFSLNQNEKLTNLQNTQNKNLMDLENQEYTIEGVETYYPNTNESNVNDPDCNTLISLKNLFQSPVIIDRF